MEDFYLTEEVSRTWDNSVEDFLELCYSKECPVAVYVKGGHMKNLGSLV